MERAAQLTPARVLARNTRPRFVVGRLHADFARILLPVVLAIVVAIAAGWLITVLNGRAYRASEVQHGVPVLVSGLVRPEELFLKVAHARLTAVGQAALAPTPGAPKRMAPSYAGACPDSRSRSSGSRSGRRSS